MWYDVTLQICRHTSWFDWNSMLMGLKGGLPEKISTILKRFARMFDQFYFKQVFLLTYCTVNWYITSNHWSTSFIQHGLSCGTIDSSNPAPVEFGSWYHCLQCCIDQPGGYITGFHSSPVAHPVLNQCFLQTAPWPPAAHSRRVVLPWAVVKV